jgi:hypothetical protein
MELFKRDIGYQDIGRDGNLTITATTVYIPIFLTQSFEDLGLYTDTKNPIFDVVTGFTGVWDTISNTGTTQKPCLVLNNCGVGSSTIIKPSFYGASYASINVNSITNCSQNYTFQWSGPNGYTNTNSLYPTGLKAGNYTLKITDSNCDISYHSFLIPEAEILTTTTSLLNSQVNDVNGTCNGSASVVASGGLAPYSYNWFINTGVTATTWVSLGLTTSTITGLCAGTYLVQTTDSTVPSVTVSSIFNITEPSVLSGNVITTINVDCFGGNTGEIDVRGFGGNIGTGYTYTLSPGLISNYTGIFKNIGSNTYSVLITDSVGSTYNLTPIIITQPVVVNATVTLLTNAGCFGGDLGSITITPSGGNGSYSITAYRNGLQYNFYNTTSSLNITGLEASLYTFDITDGNGCTFNGLSQTVYHRESFGMTINKPVQTNGYDLPCYGNTTQITATTTFTTDTYTLPTPAGNINFYANGVYKNTCSHLSGSGCTAVLTGLTAGNYTITSVSNVGCSATTFVSLTEPESLLSINLGLIEVSASDRQGVININGGVTPYTISWSDGSTDITSNVHTVGYGGLTVIVTDNNGCTTTDSITI